MSAHEATQRATLHEMQHHLRKAGFNPELAQCLLDEGMGPFELQERLKIKDGIGSLQYTHGFYKWEEGAE